MDFKDKKDEELVHDAGRIHSENSDSTEMMRRLKDSIEKLSKTTSLYSKIIILLTVIFGFCSFIQIKLMVQQINYAEIQSRSERIQQTRSINSSIEFCEQSPESEESGLFEILSGKSASCKQVLKTYKK